MDSPKKKCDSSSDFLLPAEEDIIPIINTTGYQHHAIQDFLREVNPSNPLERPCVAGEESCLAAQLTNPFTGESEGVWLREFYVPSIWNKIIKLGKLPETGTRCYFCQKYQAACRYAQLTERNYTFNHMRLNMTQEEDYE